MLTTKKTKLKSSIRSPVISMKKCSRCKEKKNIELFGNNKRTKDGKHSWCKPCTAEWAKNPKRRASKAKWKLKARYGITPEDYNSLLELQECRCAICGIHNDDLSDSLCVDHDHETGKVRGLLCRPCNLAIGNMRDNPRLLHKAGKYLENLGY